jgi:hypothetical protein
VSDPQKKGHPLRDYAWRERDFDGVWPETAYPMEVDTLDWSPRYGGN